MLPAAPPRSRIRRRLYAVRPEAGRGRALADWLEGSAGALLSQAVEGQAHPALQGQRHRDRQGPAPRDQQRGGDGQADDTGTDDDRRPSPSVKALPLA